MEEKIQIVKLTPSPEELLVKKQSNESIKCSEPECDYLARNTSVLGLHKAKVHKIKHTSSDKEKVYNYHCPIQSCYFHTDRYFKSLEVLKTHYMKLHSDKKFTCQKCKKAFGLERDCLRHEKECGQNFACLNCKKVYTSSSMLKKHCEIHQHEPPDNILFKYKKTYSSMMKTLSKKNETGKKRSKKIQNLKPILPSLPLSVVPLLCIPQKLMHESKQLVPPSNTSLWKNSLNFMSQSVQTSHLKKTAGIQTSDAQSKVGISEKLSTGIQTVLPCSSIIAETQTVESILPNNLKRRNDHVDKVCIGTQKDYVKINRLSKKTANAISQTYHHNCLEKKKLFATSTGVNTLFGDRPLEFQLENIDKISCNPLATSSTQTNLTLMQDTSKTQHNSTFQFHNIQTQTSPYVQTSDMSHLLNHQNTQTIGNIEIFNSVGLLVSSQDCETHTLKNTVLNYQDSQTQTHIKTLPNVQKPITHIETQTTLSSFKEPSYFDKKVRSLYEQDLNCSANTGLRNTQSVSNRFSSIEPISIDAMDSKQVVEPVDQPFDMLNNEALCDSSKRMSNSLDLFGINLNSVSQTQYLSNSNTDDNNFESNNLSFRINSKSCDFGQSFSLGLLGSDNTTQTMNLSWETGTQTIDDLVSDMMTQTGDELLDFLTRNTQTQTLDDFCNDRTDVGQTQTLDSLFEFLPNGDEINGEKDSNYSFIYGDHVSTQTSADSTFGIFIDDEIPLDIETSSFSSPPKIASGCGQSQQRDKNLLTSDKINNNKCKYTETSQTQTLDPIFSFFQTQNYDDAEMHVSRCTNSQTQTLSDPLLPVYKISDQTVNFPETSKETAECQTTWDDLLCLVEDSETQTKSNGSLDDTLFPAFHTQMVQTTELEDFLVTDSFTQTCLDQNTQTQFI